MNIQIQSRHGELSEPTRQKIAEKVIKLGRFIDRIAEIQVMVDLDKETQPVVEVAVVTDHKKDFRAEYSSEDFWGCFDQINDKLEQQIKKFKEKLTDRR